MNFSIETGVSAITVFLQGLLSFFSPCVLPLIPLYMGYLSGGAKETGEDGSVRYPRKKMLVNTLFFALGISFAFFLLGFGFTALGRFLRNYQTVFARVGGVLVILFGLYQCGLFGSGFLSKERRLPFRMKKMAMNPLAALVMGFTFSFAWTPCVGPALTSVLLMASSASSMVLGFLLIGVYTLGFTLPFLAVSFFTGALLDFFRKHRKGVQYTVRIGGVLMIVMGIMMVTGWMNGVTGYLSKLGQKPLSSQQDETASSPARETEPASPKPKNSKKTASPDFTLADQNGREHRLSDYRGKVVFLNFFATWCGPCRREMPDIQGVYEQYGTNQKEVVILGVANPKSGKYPMNQDGSVAEVTQFLKENGVTYPVVMDTTGEVFDAYMVDSFPTTFLIDREGNVSGYVPGMMTKSMMDRVLQQALK